MTKLLAIETTGLRGSVACALEGTPLVQELLNPEQRSAQSLVPAIESILKKQEWKPADLDAVAVATGPGSFTGLRVGVTTAKVLAWVSGASLYGVDSLEAAAWTNLRSLTAVLKKEPENHVYAEVLRRGAAVITVALNAQRGDVTARDFLVCLDSPAPIALERSFRLEPLASWLDSKRIAPTPENLSNQLPQNTHVLQIIYPSSPLPLLYAGPVLASRRLKCDPEQKTAFLPEPFGSPTAGGVALAAAAAPNADPFTLLPVYSRESAAEEKRRMAK